MTNHNREPIPQGTNPVDLELRAIEAIAHPETLQVHLLMIGGMAVAAAIESALETDNN